MSDSTSGYGVILATLFLALVLSLIPLGRAAAWWRPEWLLMVLVYWAIALPHRVGLSMALSVGLIVDVMEGAPIGQHMLSLGLVVTVARLMYQRLRVFTVAQQASVVFILVGIHQVIGQWLMGLEGVRPGGIAFLYPAFSSALLWPPVMLALRGARRGYGVI